MQITAIIVTYNSEAVIGRAIEAVCTHSDMAACMVVDNGSSDGTLGIVRNLCPQVRIISSPVNQGFAKACNDGLEQVTTPYALLMNPDAMIDAGGIDALRAALVAYPDAAMAAPFFTNADHASVRLPVFGNTSMPVISRLGDQVSSVQYLSGALMLWRMEQMREAGFFDTGFFLFYEDDDICMRTVRAGYRLLLVSGIHATHVPGHSTPATEATKALKLRSSAWSYLYIHRKYKGSFVGYAMAVWMIMKAVCMLAARKIIYDQSMHRIHNTQLQHENAWGKLLKENPQADPARHEAQWQELMRALDTDIRRVEEKRMYQCRLQAAWEFLNNPIHFAGPDA